MSKDALETSQAYPLEYHFKILKACIHPSQYAINYTIKCVTACCEYTKLLTIFF